MDVRRVVIVYVHVYFYSTPNLWCLHFVTFKISQELLFRLLLRTILSNLAYVTKFTSYPPFFICETWKWLRKWKRNAIKSITVKKNRLKSSWNFYSVNKSNIIIFLAIYFVFRNKNTIVWKGQIFCMFTNLPVFTLLSHCILIIANWVSLYESFRFYCSSAANFRAPVRVSTYPTKGVLLGRGASVVFPLRGGNGHRRS